MITGNGIVGVLDVEADADVAAVVDAAAVGRAVVRDDRVSY
jgi:hypothetical protein